LTIGYAEFTESLRQPKLLPCRSSGKTDTHPDVNGFLSTTLACRSLHEMERHNSCLVHVTVWCV